MQLSEKTYAAIDSLSQQGNTLMDDDKFDAAIEKWSQALDLLPKPSVEWEAFMWLSASIGDAQFQKKKYLLAASSLQDALNAPGGIENPFIHYRLGQCQLALGNSTAGLESLLKAYMLDGKDIFLADAGGAELLNILKDQKLIV